MGQTFMNQHNEMGQRPHHIAKFCIRRLTMKTFLCSSILISLFYLPTLAQEAANRVYGNAGAQEGNVARRRPVYPESSSEQVVAEQPNLLVTTYQFLDAKILTSVDTKEYVAVFGLAQEDNTLQSANKKLQDQIAAFRAGLGN